MLLTTSKLSQYTNVSNNFTKNQSLLPKLQKESNSEEGFEKISLFGKELAVQEDKISLSSSTPALAENIPSGYKAMSITSHVPAVYEEKGRILSIRA